MGMWIRETEFGRTFQERTHREGEGEIGGRRAPSGDAVSGEVSSWRGPWWGKTVNKKIKSCISVVPPKGKPGWSMCPSNRSVSAFGSSSIFPPPSRLGGLSRKD